MNPQGSEKALDILTADVPLEPEFERKLTFVLGCLDDPAWLARRASEIGMMKQRETSLIGEFKMRWPNQARKVGL